MFHIRLGFGSIIGNSALGESLGLLKQLLGISLQRWDAIRLDGGHQLLGLLKSFLQRTSLHGRRSANVRSVGRRRVVARK
jgi:hypothetical protein